MRSAAVRLTPGVLVAIGFVGLARGASPTWPQVEPGQTVKVTGDNAAVKIGTETLATVAAGTELAALQVKGDWVQVTVEQAGRKITGWVHRRHLTPVAPTPKAKAGPPDTPPPDAPRGAGRLTGRSAELLAPPEGPLGSFTHDQGLALVAANTKFPVTLWIMSEDGKKGEETSLVLAKADWEALAPILKEAASRTMLVTAGMAFVQFGKVPVPKNAEAGPLTDALKLMRVALPATVSLSFNTDGRTCLVCRPAAPCCYFVEAAKDPRGTKGGGPRK
jgi:hypothetical protein